MVLLCSAHFSCFDFEFYGLGFHRGKKLGTVRRFFDELLSHLPHFFRKMLSIVRKNPLRSTKTAGYQWLYLLNEIAQCSLTI
jgi:hypothetical protein